MANTLAAFALQRAFQGDVPLHQDSQRTQVCHLWSLHYQHNKVWGGVGLGGFLVTAPGANMQDSLDRDIQGLQLLLDDILRHLSAQILNQQMYTTILRDRGVKTHNLALPLNMGWEPTMTRGPYPCQKATPVHDPWDLVEGLVLLINCGNDNICGHPGIWSDATRHVTEAQTCLWDTCAQWPSQMEQWIQRDLNPD